MKLTVYSRPGCHLCQEAIDQLDSLKAGYPSLQVDEVDIEGDDELFKRYLERIPVVVIDGEEVSDLVFDREAVQSRLGNA